MIVRPARKPHVCLRCQRGLAKRSLASSSQVAFHSAGPKLREPQSFSSNSRDDEYNNEYENEEDYSRNRRPDKVAESPRLHGFRGLKKQECRETLQTNALGDPAKVIVLRDSILSLYNDNSRNKIRPKKPAHIDILGQLAEERGLVGQAEVESNINGLKPVEERQTWEEINELVRNLQDGFTTSQLQKYIENFQGREEPVQPQEEWTTNQQNAKILRVTPWLPGVSEIEDHFDNDPLRGYYLESHTVKQRVILRLLTECWRVELPELVDGIGQFEIEVRNEDLELLLCKCND